MFEKLQLPSARARAATVCKLRSPGGEVQRLPASVEAFDLPPIQLPQKCIRIRRHDVDQMLIERLLIRVRRALAHGLLRGALIGRLEAAVPMLDDPRASARPHRFRVWTS